MGIENRKPVSPVFSGSCWTQNRNPKARDSNILGPYCRWTRVRNAIASRKTQNAKKPLRFIVQDWLGPTEEEDPLVLKMDGSGRPEDLLVLKVAFLWQTNSNFQKNKSLEATRRRQRKNKCKMLLRFWVVIGRPDKSISESLPVEVSSIHLLLWYFLIHPLAPFPPTQN